MQISRKNEEYILANERGIINVDGKNYYFKPAGNEFFNFIGYEQLIELCAMEVGINCAHYETIKIGKIYFTLSPAIPGNYKTISYFDYELNDAIMVSLFDLWDLIDKKKLDTKNSLSNSVDKLLMYQVVRVYLFDLLFANPDRHLDNFVIVFDENNNPTICVLDNELSLNFDTQRSHITSKLERQSYTKYNIDKNKKFYKFLDDLEVFLKEASYEYIDLLHNMLEKLTPEVIRQNIIRIEEKNNDKYPHLYKYLEKYMEHYNNILDIVNNRRKR